ncbi:MAG: TlpA family protein disulfide reductase [Thermoflexibacter sp.]|jgi:thiol-disulfide isomerase/thioredoxin|nr:TlpA family protein disulfide reductase [Thermoflexibacter sp.]
MKISKTRILKELKEWGIFIGIFLILYFTGLYKEVAGGLQRVVLATGLRNASSQATEVGNADFSFALQPLDNSAQVTPFEAFRGKVIFLNFWATWCPPCIAEMPSIHALYEKLNTEDIVFVMVATNDKKESVQKFIERKSYNFPIYFLKDNYLPSVFHSTAIPTTFVIDKQGKIVFKHEGIANYDTEKFEQLLKELAQK